MAVIRTTSLSGEPIELEAPEPQSGETVFCLAPHKSGSVLFYNLIGELAAAAGRKTFALETELFSRGIPLTECPLDLLQVLEAPGIYIGFRTLWLLPYLRSFRASKKLLLVRDPRDICVSYYFSVAKSHGVPQSGAIRDNILKQRNDASTMDVNQFVKSGKAYFALNNMMAFMRMAKAYDDCHVFRYEDVIFDKENWVRQIADLIGIDASDETVKEIAARHDIRPDNERPDQHVRQVAPGNYKVHLNAEVTDIIQTRYKPLFDYFGYETDTVTETAKK